jgi:hypothetical protein
MVCGQINAPATLPNHVHLHFWNSSFPACLLSSKTRVFVVTLMQQRLFIRFWSYVRSAMQFVNTASTFLVQKLERFGKIWNALLKKCWRIYIWPIVWEMKKCYTVSRRRGISYTFGRRKANWIDHILSRNCLLQHVTEGKIQRSARKARKKT